MSTSLAKLIECANGYGNKRNDGRASAKTGFRKIRLRIIPQIAILKNANI
jgi:hypothetical protein